VATAFRWPSPLQPLPRHQHGKHVPMWQRPSGGRPRCSTPKEAAERARREVATAFRWPSPLWHCYLSLSGLRHHLWQRPSSGYFRCSPDMAVAETIVL